MAAKICDPCENHQGLGFLSKVLGTQWSNSQYHSAVARGSSIAKLILWTVTLTHVLPHCGTDYVATSRLTGSLLLLGDDALCRDSSHQETIHETFLPPAYYASKTISPLITVITQCVFSISNSGMVMMSADKIVKSASFPVSIVPRSFSSNAA